MKSRRGDKPEGTEQSRGGLSQKLFFLRRYFGECLWVFGRGSFRRNDHRHNVLVLARLPVDDQFSAVVKDMEKPAALYIVKETFFFHEYLQDTEILLLKPS